MGSRLLLAALLLTPLGASAIDEEDPPVLEAVLLEFVAPEKARALGATATLEAIIRAIEPKRHPEARAGLREFQSSDPDVLKKKQRAAILLEDPQNLLATSRELGGLAPEDPEAFIGEAHALALSGDFDSANAAATKALELAPNDRRAQDLAWYTRRMRAAPPEDAKPAAELKTTSGGVSQAEQQAGRRVLFRKKAVEHSREAMRRFNVGDYDDTLRFSKLAIAADPTLPDPYMQQGLALMEKREYAKAEDRFRIASTLWRLNGSEKAKLAETGLAQVRAEMHRGQASAQNPAPPTQGVPPIIPLTTGGLLIFAGAWGWKLYGRPKADELVDDFKRSMAVGVVLLGTGIAAYGAARLTSAIGPALFVGATGDAALAVDGAVATKALLQAAAGAKAAQGGMSLARKDAGAKPSSGDGAIERLEQDANSVDPVDRGGQLSKAGRSLVKHALREGSRLPKPKGNPEQINELAGKLVHDILNGPHSIRHDTLAKWGKITDYVRADGVGVRFTQDGRFLFFIGG